MQPLTFAALLAIASLAMVYAMVQFSRAYFEARDTAGWLVAYALTWVAIVILLVAFLREDLRRNLPLVIGIPLGWFALHALILRFGIALRDAPRPVARPVTELDDDLDDDEEPAHEPPLLVKAYGYLKSAAFIVLMVCLVGVGEQMESMQAIDDQLAPHRSRLVALFATLVAAGFALFMGGIIRLLLTAKQSRVIVIGAVSAIVSACALGIVALPPGGKLLVIVTVGYAVVRIVTSSFRRIRHTPTDR